MNEEKYEVVAILAAEGPTITGLPPDGIETQTRQDTIQRLIEWRDAALLKELQTLAASSNWRVLLEDRIIQLNQGSKVNE